MAAAISYHIEQKSTMPPAASLQISIRAYDEITDLKKADEFEKTCEAGSSGKKVSLFTDLLGDPLCRVRHYPAFHMLVAETVPEKKMVGVIRAGVKEVVSSNCTTNNVSNVAAAAEYDHHHGHDHVDDAPAFVRIAYILGLRVAPKYRRVGIGEQLARRMEEWCVESGAEYAYVATEEGNEPSVGLFTKKLGYEAFRRPAILLQAIGGRKREEAEEVVVQEVSREEAVGLYGEHCQRFEFFPRDIAAVLGSRPSAGTWKAIDGGSHSWAAASVWKCNEIYELEVRGAGRLLRAAASLSRALLRLPFASSCLRRLAPPPPPPLGRPFGIHLLYGVICSGPRGPHLARRLARHAASLARRDAGVALLAAELSPRDHPLVDRLLPRAALHRDLWLLKRLPPGSGGGDAWLATAARDPAELFLDPRDF